MTLEEKSKLIKEFMDKNFLFISPKTIEGGAQLVNNYETLELYENMEKNTQQFLENEIVNLMANAKHKDEEVSKRLDFNLIFCGDFDDLPNDLGSPIDFVLANQERIVAVYKYVIGTETRNIFVGFDQSEKINKYGYTYLKLDQLLKSLNENNVKWEIDTSVDRYVHSSIRDDRATKFIISYDPKKEIESDSKSNEEELNQILLSKNLNEFYLAVMENRQELLTDEEYNEITKRENVIYGDNSEEVKTLFDKVEENERLKPYSSEIKKMIYSLAQIRNIAILTMIDNEIYDIGSAKFVDIKRNKIVHYDNLTNYFDETNARVKLFTPEEEPQLSETKALLDVDDESIVQAYEDNHVHQEESIDLTSNFIDEVKNKPHMLKKENNN